jgi:hypothetical protein
MRKYGPTHLRQMAIADRKCEDCRFLSDRIARIDPRYGGVAALCLNKASRNFEKWRALYHDCAKFERGDPIDLPKEDAA